MFRSLNMFCYKSFVNDLNSEIDKLSNEKLSVDNKVQEETENGKILLADVLKWQRDVEEIQKKQKEFPPSSCCIKGLPVLNPVSCFRVGRVAMEDAKIVTELTASGKKLLSKDIAYLEGPSGTAYEDFSSRSVAYGKLWEELVREDSWILGIYGMPGVGKTRMMKQIWREAQSREKMIFDKVILAVVGSVTFDVIKLQDQLARSLNCDLKVQDDARTRANELKKRMMNSGKMLIIFDDVWGQISLHDVIGTSYEDVNSWKGCKILFISREKIHCLNNKCKNPVQITTLKDEEALNWFKNILGTDQIDSLQDESLIKKVCKKCAGLPLVIHAVGNALKFKSHGVWEDALVRLEDWETENMSKIDPQVYACLKLSFDNLLEDAKQCLLLCSLFLSDEIIDIKTLTRLATGSQLVKGGRTRVRAMVDTLKSSSLLLPEGEDGQEFKLHDIIRDIARSIAVKDYAFLIEKRDLWYPGDSADYAAGKVMHLELANDEFDFPHDLVCPDLHTLWLRSLQKWNFEINNIPNFSGEMFANLRCLVLFNFSWLQEQQQYIQSLDKLKTLFLLGCNIGDADIISCFPNSLETLYIRDCHLPSILDLKNLTDLRELDISVENRSQMEPNTISSLSRLEELCLEESIYDDMDTGTIMPNFKEICELTHLTSLKILWNDFDPSQDTSIFHSLIRFDIRVGVGVENEDRPASHAASTRLIELSGKEQFECFHNLVERAEEVILRGTAVEISIIWERNREAFKDLRNLYIYSCDTLEFLARIPQDEVQQSLQQQTSFSKLTILELSSCESLKYLFSNTVAERLEQLQKLAISDCNAMEVVVMNEGPGDGHIINFSKLKSLKMSKLNNLKSFYGEEKDMQSSSTSMINNCVIIPVHSQSLFDGMVAFPSLEVLHIEMLQHISDIWGKSYSDSSSFCKLNSFDGFTEGIIVFPELKELKLCNLPNLTGLCCHRSGQANSYKVQFPNLVKFILKDLEINLEWIELGKDDSPWNLKHLSITYDEEKQLPSTWKLLLYNLESLILRHCWSDVLKSLCFFKRLKVLQVTKVECPTLFSLKALTSLQQLRELEISDCTLLEEIMEDVRDDEASGMVKENITLIHLTSVSLKDLPNLKSFIHGENYELHMPNLICMQVDKCGLSTLFTCSVLQKLQQLQELHVGDCNLLESIVADGKGIEIPGTDDKIIILSRLSSVELRDLPNLKNFAHGANYEVHMPALLSVRIRNCGLPTLFTLSVFQTFQQLENLRVVDCDLLEGIVADERHIKTTDSKIITLPQLSQVMLYNIPNLTSLSLTVDTSLNMPKLSALRIYMCPHLENISSLKTSPGVAEVYTVGHDNEIEVTDFDDYIRQQGKKPSANISIWKRLRFF